MDKNTRSVSPPSLAASWRARWFVPALLAGLIILYFAPMLLGNSDFGSDGQLAAYSGPLEFWSSLWATGWPVVGDPLSMTLYPLRMILAATQAAFDAYVASAYIVAVIGMYGFLSRLVDRFPAAFGALAFTLSGWMLVHLGHTSMIHAAAWLPWIMLGVHAACSVSGAQRLIGTAVLGLAVAMGLAAGHAQITVYSMLLAGCYTLFLVLRGRAWLGLLCCLAGVLLGIAIAAPVLLPAIEWTGHTLRSELTTDELFSYAFPLTEAPGLLLPLVYGSIADSWFGVAYRTPAHSGETITFLPAIGILLGIIALLSPVRRGQVLFFAAYGVAALVLATGARFAVAGFITEHTPLLNMFRASSRHFLEVSFCFAVAAAIGLQGLGSGKLSRRQLWLAGSVLVLLLVIAATLALVTSASMGMGRSDMLKPMIFAALAVVASLYVLVQHRRGPVMVGWMALLVLLAQTWLIGHQLPWRLGQQGSLEARGAEWVPDVQSELGSDYRGLALDGWEAVVFNPDASRLHGVNTLGWYGPLLHHDVVQLTGLTTGGWIRRFVLEPDDATLDLLAVRYVAVREAERKLLDSQPARWRLIRNYGDEYLYENRRVLPRARLACKAEVMDADAFINAVRTSGPGLSFVDTAYMTDGNPQLPALGDDCRGQVRIVSDRGHALELQAEVAAEQALLVLADLWYPGWTARVNGEDRPVQRVNATARGVLVERGDNRVELHYQPTHWGTSLIISMLGVGLLLGLPIAGLIASRRRIGCRAQSTATATASGCRVQ